MLVIDIVSLILFSDVKTEVITNEKTEVEINCIKGNTTYMITVDTTNKYNCDNCSDEINKDIKNIINHSGLDLTVRNIENYFENIMALVSKVYNMNM